MISNEAAPSPSRRSIRSLFMRNRKWILKSGSAIADQGLFAGSNFIVNLLLANWMTKEDYGAFAVAYAWFLLLQTLYDSVMVSPMTYYGPKKYNDQFKRYLGYVYQGHLLAGSAITLVLLAIAFGVFRFNSELLGLALAGMAIGAPLLLMRSMTREPFYILSMPQWSAVGGLIYMLLNIGFVIGLHLADQLTPFSALVSMGAAVFLTWLSQSILILKPQFRDRTDTLNSRAVVADHWQYGRWSLPSRWLQWLSANFATLLIPLIPALGLVGSASLKAAMNLVMPIFMTSAAMVSLLTPIYVRTYDKQGKAALHRRMIRMVSLISFLTGGYALFMILFGKGLISFLYNGKYDADISFLFVALIALVPMITTISRNLDAALMAMGKIKLTFQSKVLPTIMTVVLDILLITRLGVTGYAIVALVTAAMTLGLLILYYRRLYKQPDEPVDPLSEKATPQPTEVLA